MAQKSIIKTILDGQDELFEFLLEEEDEFLSLEQAIAMARNQEIADVQVCQSKQGKIYLRAKPDATQPNNLRSLAPRPCCGPEIGTYLNRLMENLREEFFRWPAGKQADCCASLTTPSLAATNWDIIQLYTPQNAVSRFDRAMSERRRDLGGQSFNDFGCATKRCRRTVMVGGNCYEASRVNYAAFGGMFRLCHDHYPVDQANKLSGYSWAYNTALENIITDTPPTEEGDREFNRQFVDEYFSLDSTTSRIWQWQRSIPARVWRGIFSRGSGSYSASGAINKIEWAKAGYSGVYTSVNPPSAGIRPCGRCNHDARLYNLDTMFPLRARWNGNIIPQPPA